MSAASLQPNPPSDALAPDLEQCGICLESIKQQRDLGVISTLVYRVFYAMSQQVNPTKITTLECRHTFHTDCIDEWLLQNRTCPFCRAPVQSSEKPSARRDVWLVQNLLDWPRRGWQDSALWMPTAALISILSLYVLKGASWGTFYALDPLVGNTRLEILESEVLGFLSIGLAVYAVRIKLLDEPFSRRNEERNAQMLKFDNALTNLSVLAVTGIAVGRLLRRAAYWVYYMSNQLLTAVPSGFLLCLVTGLVAAELVFQRNRGSVSRVEKNSAFAAGALVSHLAFSVIKGSSHLHTAFAGLGAVVACASWYFSDSAIQVEPLT